MVIVLTLRSRVLKLNALDPKSIGFEREIERNPLGEYERVTKVKHQGKLVMKADAQSNLERIRRGWTVIYSKYCKGTVKEF